MGIRSRLGRIGRVAAGPRHPDGEAEVIVGDAGYDDWEVVRDFAELEAARAWCQSLTERGIPAVLTADWPLDEFGRGDIALRVPRDSALEAEELLDDPS